MQISDEIFQEYIAQWQRRIERLAKRYQQWSESSMKAVISVEDLVQDGMLACYSYLRNVSSQDAVRFPAISVRNAMVYSVMNATPARITKDAHLFKKAMGIANETGTTSVEALPLVDERSSFENEAVLRCDIERFLSVLDEKERRVATFRLYGDTNQEIARKLDTAVSDIEATVKRLRRRYRNYMSEGIA